MAYFDELWIAVGWEAYYQTRRPEGRNWTRETFLEFEG